MTWIQNFPSSHMATKFSLQVSVARSERKLVKTHQISTFGHKYRRMIKYFVLYLIYRQLLLNSPNNDSQVFYILFWMFATLDVCHFGYILKFLLKKH
jgi:hypothetical protein